MGIIDRAVTKTEPVVTATGETLCRDWLWGSDESDAASELENRVKGMTVYVRKALRHYISPEDPPPQFLEIRGL